MRTLMRWLVGLAALVTVLAWNSHAAAGDLPAPTGRIVVPRCIDAPVSLALEIAEEEARRLAGGDAFTSPGHPVLATPGQRVVPRHEPRRLTAPLSPIPRACLSPSDPGCQVSRSGTVPQGNPSLTTIEPSTTAPWCPSEIPAPTARRVSVPGPTGAGPRAAFERLPWRPPAR